LHSILDGNTDTSWVSQLAPIMIGVGLIIIVAGLAQIVYAKVRKTGLVKTGLYRYVRHPQHTGIAILSFGILMLNAYGVRIGDVFAWTLIVFVYVLLADSEDASLEREYGEAYSNYRKRVPYMIPFLPSASKWTLGFPPRHGWKRKLVFIVFYLLVVVVITCLLTMLPRFHIR
jgi:protein-S-isoprenylcysteine O-methyltransferase Ste14